MTYTVTVRGHVPADIVEKMSQVLAQAQRQQKARQAAAAQHQHDEKDDLRYRR